MDLAYDEFDPVAAFGGDVNCHIFTSLVVFRDAKLHGNEYPPMKDSIGKVNYGGIRATNGSIITMEGRRDDREGR